MCEYVSPIFYPSEVVLPWCVYSRKTWILSPIVSLKSNRSFPPTSPAASSSNSFMFTPPSAGLTIKSNRAFGTVHKFSSLVPIYWIGFAESNFAGVVSEASLFKLQSEKNFQFYDKFLHQLWFRGTIKCHWHHKAAAATSQCRGHVTEGTLSTWVVATNPQDSWKPSCTFLQSGKSSLWQGEAT